MNEHIKLAAAAAPGHLKRIHSEASMPEERLPFTIRVVRSESELLKAIKIRQAAYARHVPEFAAKLHAPETYDAQQGVVVLLAESKLDGTALGTMRIQTNAHHPLPLEQSIELPDWLQARPLAEASRLGVTEHKVGRAVKTMLFKAFFLYCQQQGIEWMVITGRSPIDRQYERLLFSDVYPGKGYIPLAHVNNLPHRIMSFEVDTAEARWAAADHPLFDFIFRTRHPDIDLSATALRPTARWHGADDATMPLVTL